MEWILERLANTLDVPLVEFFKAPPPGAKRPEPLRRGRRKS